MAYSNDRYFLDWIDLRSTIHPPPWEPPATCLEWAHEDRGSLLVVAGDQEKRDLLYHQVGALHVEPKDTWQDKLFTGFLADRLSKLRSIGSIVPHEWDLLWNLITVDEIHFDPSLQDLVNQGKLYARINNVLNEARSRLDENVEVKPVVKALGKWLSVGQLEEMYDQSLLGMRGPNLMPVPYERFDALFFLVTLSSLNGLLAPTVLVLDGLEGILGHYHRKGLAKELVDLCMAIDRWSRMGCPLKFIFGLSEENSVTQLGKVYGPLGAYLGERLNLV
jgi:hypothetical protein